MENAKNTEAPFEGLSPEDMLKKLASNKEAVSGVWKHLMSFIGFAAGLLGGYLFFAVGKDKEIAALKVQVDDLLKQNQKLTETLSKTALEGGRWPEPEKPWKRSSKNSAMAFLD